VVQNETRSVDCLGVQEQRLFQGIEEMAEGLGIRHLLHVVLSADADGGLRVPRGRTVTVTFST
jgi:hypothetical protein